MGGNDNDMTEVEESTLRCPKCSADLASHAVLCIDCGYNLREGRYLPTVVKNAGTTERIESGNPYQSPVTDDSPPEFDSGTRLEASIAKGRRLMRLVILVIVAFGVAVPLLKMLMATERPETFALTSFAVRSLILFLWCYFLYQGGDMSKWLTVVGHGVLSISYAFLAVRGLFNVDGNAVSHSEGTAVAFAVYAAVYAVAFGFVALILVFSPSVDDFRWHQQENAKQKMIA